VIDAVTGAARGSVALRADVGNVALQLNSDQMLVAVQGHNELAVIDPATPTVTARVALPGCQHSHGLVLGPGNRLVFLACDGNATLLRVDLTTGRTGLGTGSCRSHRPCGCGRPRAVGRLAAAAGRRYPARCSFLDPV
jgi:DNA-binding beta-propeller fold protein YncE